MEKGAAMRSPMIDRLLGRRDLLLDRCKGRIGVVLDAAIALSREELSALGFKRGRRRGGYQGDYFELSA